MQVERLFQKLENLGSQDALVWREKVYSFQDLLSECFRFLEVFESRGVKEGSVIALQGDFSPNAIGGLLACLRINAIAVPLTASVSSKTPEYLQIAEADWSLNFSGDSDQIDLQELGFEGRHPLISALKERRHPGLILFSSGSTGASKAVLHDFSALLEKYLKPRHQYRTLAFLLFDHIGGIDTLLYNLANGSCLVTVESHSPEDVCRAVERYAVEVLPVSPTFINLLLLEGAHLRHDLSSLKVITYGAEVMPEPTLLRLHRELPAVKLMQKFGATEIGTMRSISRDSTSVWLKVGGEGFDTRIVDGLLEVKAVSAMLGYLNAPSPFTPDGWFKTGDRVEVDGEWIRIIGRDSEIVNIGGEKVFPCEVESVILGMDGVEDAMVFGQTNPITGHILVAKVNLAANEPASAFRRRLWEFCKDRLPTYKIPQKVVVSGDSLSNRRFKKVRRQTPDE